jgi:transcription elongation factor Elf1
MLTYRFKCPGCEHLFRWIAYTNEQMPKENPNCADCGERLVMTSATVLVEIPWEGNPNRQHGVIVGTTK